MWNKNLLSVFSQIVVLIPLNKCWFRSHHYYIFDFYLSWVCFWTFKTLFLSLVFLFWNNFIVFYYFSFICTHIYSLIHLKLLECLLYAMHSTTKKKGLLFWSFKSRGQVVTHKNVNLFIISTIKERYVVILDRIKGYCELERGQAGLPWWSSYRAKSWEKSKRNQAKGSKETACTTAQWQGWAKLFPRN